MFEELSLFYWLGSIIGLIIIIGGLYLFINKLLSWIRHKPTKGKWNWFSLLLAILIWFLITLANILM